MTPEAVTSKAKLLDRKLRDLHQHRADLVVESENLRIQQLNTNGHGLLLDRLRSAILHRLNRIPALLEYVDRQIDQARADVDNHAFWHGTRVEGGQA